MDKVEKYVGNLNEDIDQMQEKFRSEARSTIQRRRGEYRGTGISRLGEMQPVCVPWRVYGTVSPTAPPDKTNIPCRKR